MSWLSEQEEQLMKDYIDQYNLICRKISRIIGNKDYFHKNYNLTSTLIKIKDEEPIECKGGVLEHMENNKPKPLVYSFEEKYCNLCFKKHLPGIICQNPMDDKFIINVD